MISRTRLQQQLADLQDVTAPGKGINRLAFTDADWQGRAYLMGLMREVGMELREDAFGNVIGHVKGADESLPAVMFGSHGDSVPQGGNFDGIVGILAAIETVRSMREDGFTPQRPLEVVLFLCEESSRFSAATLGSRAMRGELSHDDLLRLHDKEGHTLYEVLKSRHLDPDHIESARYTRPLRAFLELHIEQGKVLEHEGLPIGLVTGIAAPTRFYVNFHGSADHSGATPMDLCHDGLCAAAEAVLAVEREASSYTEAPVVGTVGILQVTPGVMNVIPGEVRIGVDIRSISAEAKDAVEQAVRQDIEAIAERRQLTYDIEPVSKEQPARMDAALVDLLEDTAKELAIPCRKMMSGAGHDSMHWADYAPTAMLFIPCRAGISHNPAEHAELSDIVRGTELLSAAVRKLVVD